MSNDQIGFSTDLDAVYVEFERLPQREVRIVIANHDSGTKQSLVLSVCQAETLAKWLKESSK